MSKRAPPGKTYFCSGPNATPVLIDFPDRPDCGWTYQGKLVIAVRHLEHTFETEDGARYTFAEWRDWGAAGQLE